ncbi:MAG: beta-glucosidase BglX [Fidelibacterota bacterium]
MKTFIWIPLILGLATVTMSGQVLSPEEIATKVEALLSRMTLTEKIGQMNQYSNEWDITGPKPVDDAKAYRYNDIKNGNVGSMLNVVGAAATRAAQQLAVDSSRLHIPLIFGIDVIHGFKTAFPVPLAMAATWNPELAEKAAAVAAAEAAASGIHWTFAPMSDISPDARWGRIMEGAGEDPFLASQMVSAQIRGYQGNDLGMENTIAACAKHYAAYGAARAGRDYNAVELSPYSIFNIYLPPFKAAVDAGVVTFMNAFNTLNGVPATGNRFLVNDILKGKWGFDGFVVSDWSSIAELIDHGVATDLRQAAEIAVSGMTDMDMESFAYRRHLESLVREGKVDEALIDESVRRILTIKYQLGLFEDPYKYCSEERERTQLLTDENRALAREIAAESMVLLKNSNNLLPLAKDIKSIAVVGPLSNDKDAPLGNWRCQAGTDNAVSLLEGIQTKVLPGTRIHFVKGLEIDNNNVRSFDGKVDFNNDGRIDFKSVIKAARRSEVIIAAVGETAMMSGEARSRMDIGLPGRQLELLQELNRLGKPVVVVLFGGRPLTIPWLAENVPAILMSWEAGSESGNAIADILFGDVVPSGKLPVTFPYHVGQEPLVYNELNTGRPQLDDQQGFVSKYIDGPKEPLYPFGYGLSYTDFEYANLKLNQPAIRIGETLRVSITLKNTGKFNGKAVVQLYVCDLVASIARPVKELKAFEKVELKAGESQEITFTLDDKAFGFYNDNYEFVVEPGEFEIMVGGNSTDVMKTKCTIME